ncbi:MAG: sodium:solute symporter [Sedimentisphaerales bacterium]|nr:sodium:solute symporter [Sedimentisphaerales bacterium]
MNISGIDLAVIIVYLVGIVALGCWAGTRRKSVEGGGYFLAGRSLIWPIIGLALFSTNISTVHLVSLAQEGYNNGLAYGNFEWMAAFTLIALGLFFAPFYIRSKVATLPDFLEKRYNRACRDWLAILSIISAIFIHIGFSLYAGAVVLKGLFNINIYVSIVSIAVITGIYTIIGGLLAVVLTESLQTVILIIGAVLVTAFGLHRVGWWSGLVDSVEPIKMTILRPAGDASGLPWYSVFLGYPIIGLWYWCADQTIVQRVLGAKDENHARVGPIFAGFIKILPVFIFVLPGLLCLALVAQGKISADGLSIIGEKGEGTYATLINELLPVGLKGVVAAALLAALMSTVSGALNSIATLFSYDIYKRYSPKTSEQQLVSIGRVVTFIAMIVAIFWSLFLGRFDSIFQGINAMICYIAPPITVVFLWGVFWKGASSFGARAALYIGSFLGLVVFIVDWCKDYAGMFSWLNEKIPALTPVWNAWDNYSIPFMMMAFYLFVACSIILLVGSMIKPHVHTETSAKLVWEHPLACLRDPGWKGFGNYKFLAALLFVVMVILYIVFK